MIRADGYEIILGSSVDPQFGPVLMFGTGGKLVEIFKDRALGLPPLNCTLARRMIEQTKIYKAFKGVRGNKPVDMDQLESILVRFAELVVDQPMIKEIDINPLLVSGDQIVALDARVILHPADVDPAELPIPAIRPYPNRYVQPFTMKNEDRVTIRPIRPEDEPLMIEFHRTLSEETVRQRYFGAMKLSERMSHTRLRRICFTDYDREIVLVAEHVCEDGEREILGVGRLSKGGNRHEAEFAVVIGTPWQGQGLGTELLSRLVRIGMEEKLCRITGQMFSANHRMIEIAREVGFEVSYESDGATCRAVLDLPSPSVAT
jgi:acetyltransferase